MNVHFFGHYKISYQLPDDPAEQFRESDFQQFFLTFWYLTVMNTRIQNLRFLYLLM